MAQAYGDIYNSLASVYDPQTSLINQQIAALPGQEKVQTDALNQAKVNAFKDIDNSANSKGILFSGFSPDQQASYIGTKYLPALAGVKQQTSDNQFKLQSALNDVTANRSKQAQDTLAQQQANDIAAAKAAAQAAKGSGGLSAYQQYQISKDQASQYKLGQFSSGNYKATGPGGAPISLYQYASATQTPLLDLLRNSGSQYDKNAYNDAQVWLKQGGEDFALQKLQQHYNKLF